MPPDSWPFINQRIPDSWVKNSNLVEKSSPPKMQDSEEEFVLFSMFRYNYLIFLESAVKEYRNRESATRRRLFRLKNKQKADREYIKTNPLLLPVVNQNREGTLGSTETGAPTLIQFI